MGNQTGGPGGRRSMDPSGGMRGMGGRGWASTGMPPVMRPMDTGPSNMTIAGPGPDQMPPLQPQTPNAGTGGIGGTSMPPSISHYGPTWPTAPGTPGNPGDQMIGNARMPSEWGGAVGPAVMPPGWQDPAMGRKIMSPGGGLGSTDMGMEEFWRQRMGMGGGMDMRGIAPLGAPPIRGWGV